MSYYITITIIVIITVIITIFDISVRLVKKQWRVEAVGSASSPENFIYFFHFTIEHSGAFSYTNSKVLFAIKCKERYVIMVFLAIDSDTDIKTSSFH